MRRIFAHRFKYSHDRRRRQLKRAADRGEVKLLERTTDGWLYEVPDDFKIQGERHGLCRTILE